jgi:hypothetical protein
MPEDLTPKAGHNKSPVDALLEENRKLRREHSRHSKAAIENLHRFLQSVAKTCEYARQNEETRKGVELALYHAGVEPPGERDWFRAIIAASYSTADERKVEKSNITKWALALCNADRNGITADKLPDWLAGKSIAQLANAETQARRQENPKAATAPKVDQAFEAAIAKSRQLLPALSGIELADGARFGLLVIERRADGIYRVAQATAEPKDIRRYFPDLPKRGRKPQEAVA